MDLVDIGGRTASQEKFLRRMLQVKADKFSLPADLMDKMNLVNLENTRYPISKQLGYLKPFFYAHRQKNEIIFERGLQNRELKLKSHPAAIIAVCEKCGQKFAYGSGEGQCQSRFRNKAQQINDSVLLCDSCKKKESFKLYDENVYSLKPIKPAKKEVEMQAANMKDLF